MDEDLGERPRGKIHRVKSDKNSLLDENRLTRQALGVEIIDSAPIGAASSHERRL
jgi:hypothetical protein